MLSGNNKFCRQKPSMKIPIKQGKILSWQFLQKFTCCSFCERFAFPDFFILVSVSFSNYSLFYFSNQSTLRSQKKLRVHFLQTSQRSKFTRIDCHPNSGQHKFTSAYGEKPHNLLAGSPIDFGFFAFSS